MKKGQFSIEYFGSMVLFLVAVVGLSTIGADQVPDFRNDVQEASLNLEAYSFSTRLMSHPGYHSYADGGTNWEKNQSTLENIENLGLASEYKVLDKDKIGRLSTIGTDKLNYSLLTNSMELSNDYRIRFTWFPVITASKSYTRTNPPSNIIEPQKASYDNADNRVHYSVHNFISEKYCFLIVSHDGVYDTVYKTEFNGSATYSCRFNDQTTRIGAGGNIVLSGYPFRIEQIQNRPDQPGSSMILRRHVRTYGAAFDRNARTIKINRYAVLNAGGELQPLKMEVWAW